MQIRGRSKLSVNQPEKQKYEGGSTRTAMDVRMDLIPSALLRAVGRRIKFGAARHGENNWRKGGREFQKATINHALKHFFDYIELGNPEDLDALACNIAFLCDLQERFPLHEKPDAL
jgi:hypothetical protein